MKLIGYDALVNEKKNSIMNELKKRISLTKTLALIDEFHPDEVALEAPFSGKMCNLSQTRTSTRVWQWLQVFIVIFPSPNILPKVKMAITGNGNAGKSNCRNAANLLCDERISTNI